MCGIVLAVVSHDATKAEVKQARRDFHDALRQMDVRGGDAWGIAYTSTPHQLAVITGAKKYSDAGRKVLPQFVPGMLVVGHTRFATRGDTTLQNAHPFRHLHGAWAHNGSYDHPIADEGPHEEVDSYYLTGQIAQACEMWCSRALPHSGYGTVVGIEAHTQMAYLWSSSGSRHMVQMGWGVLVTSTPTQAGIKRGTRITDIRDEDLYVVLPDGVEPTDLTVSLPAGHSYGFGSSWSSNWSRTFGDVSRETLVPKIPVSVASGSGEGEPTWEICMCCGETYAGQGPWICDSCAEQQAAEG